MDFISHTYKIFIVFFVFNVNACLLAIKKIILNKLGIIFNFSIIKNTLEEIFFGLKISFSNNIFSRLIYSEQKKFKLLLIEFLEQNYERRNLKHLTYIANQQLINRLA